MIKCFQNFCQISIRVILMFSENQKYIVPLFFGIMSKYKKCIYENFVYRNFIVFILFLDSFSIRLEKLLSKKKNH